MYHPFPASELGTYDLVAVRFVSSVASREEWSRAIANLIMLLKPGVGWLQWIDSCNFSLYNSVPGTSRGACQEIYDGLDMFREGKVDPVIGLMMREDGTGNFTRRREEVWRRLGMVDVHEDVFSSDRVQDLDGMARERETRNVIDCFLACLEGLVKVQGSGWTTERIESLKERAMREIEKGVYHTLDQVCIIGRRGEA